MKYKIGYKVRVRKDLEVGKEYGYWGFARDMFLLIGKEVTIESVYNDSYTIKEDNHHWTDEMFEEFKYNYKKGTKLRRIKDDYYTKILSEIVTLREDIFTNNDCYIIKNTEEYQGVSIGFINNFEEVKEEDTDIIKKVMDNIHKARLAMEDGVFYLVSTPTGKSDCLKELMKGGEKMYIETLKNFNPKNLSEGKRQAEEEKANYEAAEAKKAYTALINQKEELERIIKTTNEELKKVKESLAVFK